MVLYGSNVYKSLIFGKNWAMVLLIKYMSAEKSEYWGKTLRKRGVLDFSPDPA
jgi:hypothetical protein